MSNHNDFMEYGDSNLVPLPDGWYLNKLTKETIDPWGCVYDVNGELIYDPNEDIADKNYDEDEYEFYDH